jgi:phage terminase large subunit-like protein
MPAHDSLANSIASLSASERQRLIDRLTPAEAEGLLYDWRFWARPDQLLPDGEWAIALALAGRGWGKSRTGAEWVREQVEKERAGRIALIAPTSADVRDVMVEGESGLLAVFPPAERPHYEPSKRRVTFASGAIATTYSADEPDRLRGPQHDGAWADEIASWRYPEAWDMLMFGLRLGDHPQVVATTTPRPTPLIKNLAGRTDGTVYVVRGSTFDNAANLSPSALAELRRRYEGTRLGRQELYAEIIDDVEGALWTRQSLEDCRVRQSDLPAFTRIVVGVDPSGGVAETGIVVAGLGTDQHGYILDDCTAGGSPNAWGEAVIDALDKYEADRIVAEVNQGGAMVSSTLRTVRDNAPIRTVRAARGKQARAEPVAALYEQRRVHHVGAFPQLEDQLASWEPTSGAPSPDRLDALVWALTDLMLSESEWAPQGLVVAGAGRRYG